MLKINCSFYNLSFEFLYHLKIKCSPLSVVTVHVSLYTKLAKTVLSQLKHD